MCLKAHALNCDVTLLENTKSGCVGLRLEFIGPEFQKGPHLAIQEREKKERGISTEQETRVERNEAKDCCF